jgi:FkbM family methyltransferase
MVAGISHNVIRLLQKLATAIGLLIFDRGDLVRKLRETYYRFWLTWCYPNYVPLKLRDGTQWFLPTKESTSVWIYSNPYFDRKGLETCGSILMPGDIVLDVGANWGLYSKYLSKHVGREGKIIAFEPFEDTAEILRFQLQHSSNCQIETIGLWSQICNLDLSIDPMVVSAQRTIYPAADSNSKATSTTLDHVWESLGKKPISLIKLDTEGSELHILKGGTNLLQSESPPYIYVEINPETLQKHHHSPNDLLVYLRSIGFSFIYGGKITSHEAICAAANKWGYINILAVPSKGMFSSRVLKNSNFS